MIFIIKFSFWSFGYRRNSVSVGREFGGFCSNLGETVVV